MKNTSLLLLLLVFAGNIFSQTNPEKINDNIEKEASYPGGFEKMKSFLSDNILYPSTELEEKPYGTVYTQLLIDANGKIIEIEILRSVSKALDLEVIRVIEKMSNWLPAISKEGVAVKSTVILPIAFKLD